MFQRFHKKLCRCLFKATFAYVLALIGLCVPSMELQAQRYVELTGEVSMVTYLWRHATSNQIPEEKWGFRFKTITGTNEWRTENDASANGLDRMYFDGTNLYHYLRATKDPVFPDGLPLGIPKIARVSAASPSLTINIRPTDVPIDGVANNVTWLAFCSGTYLKTPNRVLPLPTGNRAMPDALAYADRLRCFEDSLGLPKDLDLLTSQKQALRSAWDDRLQHYDLMEKARSRPHTNQVDGLVRFHYEVSSTTNYEDWTFPMAFNFSEFFWDRQGVRHLQATGSGRVITIQNTVKPLNLFEPGASQGFIDWRFHNANPFVDAIQYWSTTLSATPATNDPVLIKLFDEAIQRAKGVPTKNPNHRLIFALILFVLATLPPVLWLIFRNHQAAKTPI
jgi:hypothetical protein